MQKITVFLSARQMSFCFKERKAKWSDYIVSLRESFAICKAIAAIFYKLKFDGQGGFLFFFCYNLFMDFVAQIYIIFFALMVILMVAWFLFHKDKPSENKNRAEMQKKENLKKVLNLLRSHHKITNNDVEHLLHVSNSTAWRYLEELEKEGYIKQIGVTGKQVYYQKS